MQRPNPAKAASSPPQATAPPPRQPQPIAFPPFRLPAAAALPFPSQPTAEERQAQWDSYVVFYKAEVTQTRELLRRAERRFLNAGIRYLYHKKIRLDDADAARTAAARLARVAVQELDAFRRRRSSPSAAERSPSSASSSSAIPAADAAAEGTPSGGGKATWLRLDDPGEPSLPRDCEAVIGDPTPAASVFGPAFVRALLSDDAALLVADGDAELSLRAYQRFYKAYMKAGATAVFGNRWAEHGVPEDIPVTCVRESPIELTTFYGLATITTSPLLPASLPFSVAMRHVPNPPTPDTYYDDLLAEAKRKEEAAKSEEGAEGGEEDSGGGATAEPAVASGSKGECGEETTSATTDNKTAAAEKQPPPHKPHRSKSVLEEGATRVYRDVQPSAAFCPITSRRRRAVVAGLGAGTWDVIASFRVDDLRRVLSTVLREASTCITTAGPAVTLRRLLLEAVEYRCDAEGYTHFYAVANVPVGPFVGEHANACCISPNHLRLCHEHTAFFDATFTSTGLDWGYLRVPSRELVPRTWAFLWRRSQTAFPRTERETKSRARSSQPLLLLPNPHERFYLRLDGPGLPESFVEDGFLCPPPVPPPSSSSHPTSNFNRSARKKFAERLAAVRSTRITVNRDFLGTLYRMRAYHHDRVRNSATWFDPDYIEYLAEMLEDDSLNSDCAAERAGPRDVAGIRLSATDSDTDEPEDATLDHPAEGVAPQPSVTSMCRQLLARPMTAVDGQEEGSPGDPTSSWSDPLAVQQSCQWNPVFDYAVQKRLQRAPVRLMVFELWDNETDELLASTYGFRVGNAFHDCSMATYTRCRAQYGHLLSHAVADILRASGVGLWYWGAELPYMTKYRQTATARSEPASIFLNRWRMYAVQHPTLNVETVLQCAAYSGTTPPYHRRMLHRDVRAKLALEMSDVDDDVGTDDDVRTDDSSTDHEKISGHPTTHQHDGGEEDELDARLPKDALGDPLPTPMPNATVVPFALSASFLPRATRARFQL